MNYYETEETSLVIPDAHVRPNTDLSRFDLLGNFILDKRPTRIIILGDFLTFESLSSFDLDKPGLMENRRYERDIATGKEALGKIVNPLKELQDKQRRNKEKIYRPDLVFIAGNHEVGRIKKYLENKPELKGKLDLERDLSLFEEFGFTHFVDYKHVIEFNGVMFTHALINAAGQPVSGKYALFRSAEMVNKSVVQGHCHRRESLNHNRHGSVDIIQIFIAGAFFEEEDDYARDSLNFYWKGVSLLSHWADGRFDIEDWSLERLRRTYA